MARAEHIRDYLDALSREGAWYKWKKNDDTGNPIPSDHRMTYENLEILDGGEKPTKKECEDGLKVMQDRHDARPTNRASAKTKLIDLGFSEDEIKDTWGL